MHSAPNIIGFSTISKTQIEEILFEQTQLQKETNKRAQKKKVKGTQTQRGNRPEPARGHYPFAFHDILVAAGHRFCVE